MNSWDAYIAVEAARLYYQCGLSMTEVGERLGVSRFRVSRLVGAAREKGWVRIDIGSPPGLELGLSRELAAVCEPFGVTRVLVTAEAGGRPGFERVAGDVAQSSIEPDDVVGFACGETVNRVVGNIRRLPPCKVVQLTGITRPGEYRDSSVETIRRVARLSGSDVRPVFEPMVMPSAVAAQERREHPSLARAFSRWEQLTRAIITVGAWRANESNVYDSAALSQAERQQITLAGCAAEFCGHMVNVEGDIIAEGVTNRFLAIPMQRLRAAVEIIAVCAKPQRAEAIRAALRSGVIKTLVVTGGVARKILELD